MDGVCALKPCQTNFHTQLVAMTTVQNMTVMVNCSWLRNRATTFFFFFPRLSFLEQKISAQVKSSQLFLVPIFADKSGSKIPCHSLPLATTIQVTHIHCSAQAQVCTAAVLNQNLHSLMNFRNSSFYTFKSPAN